MPPRRILIIGGSTRAAANSVRRAGWEPICADLFADFDLQMTAETVSVRDYPESLPEDVAAVRADGWMYCGALENHPQILARVSRCNPSLGPLLGTSPDALIRLRDPYWIMTTLKAAGVSCLEVAQYSSPPPADGGWLQKPLASAGGRLIRVWNQLAAMTPFSEPHYFQRLATGVELSALFLFNEGKLREWLGATWGLGTTSSSNAPVPFAYCGSYGPVADLPVTVVNAVTATAEAIGQKSPGLNGLIGFDFILDEGRIWLVEINPRYTASVEVLELASGRSFLNPEQSAPHDVSVKVARSPVSSQEVPRETQQNALAPALPCSAAKPRSIVAKQILYASRSIRAPDLREYFRSNDPWVVPSVADIPQVSTSIEAGWPICTVMSSGPDFPTVQATLKSQLSLIQAKIAE